LAVGMLATLVDARGVLSPIERFTFSPTDSWEAVKRQALAAMLSRSADSQPLRVSDWSVSLAGCRDAIQSTSQLHAAGRRGPLILQLHCDNIKFNSTQETLSKSGGIAGPGSTRPPSAASVSSKFNTPDFPETRPDPARDRDRARHNAHDARAEASPRSPAEAFTTVDCSWDWRCGSCGRTNIVQPLSSADSLLTGRRNLAASHILPYVQCSGCARVREWKCTRASCGALSPAVVIKQGGSACIGGVSDALRHLSQRGALTLRLSFVARLHLTCRGPAVDELPDMWHVQGRGKQW
jgi:hypothetical protein